MKLETTKWGAFRVGDLFEICYSKVYHTRELEEASNGLPYVTRGKFDNGLKCYVRDRDDLVHNPAGVISFGAEGSSFFYQADEYVSGRDMYYLDTQNLSENVCLFVISALNRMVERYSYTNGMFPKKVAVELICLPVTDTGQPDWAYMEEYMARTMAGVRGTVEALRKVAKDRHPVCVEDWGEFRVGDLFEIEPCRGKNSTLLNDGSDIAYIAASKENNGFNKMVSLSGFEDWVSKGNCLQFIHIGDGAAGWVNYMADDFIGMAGKSSCAYNPHMNEYIGLFLASVLCRKNNGIYSFKESWTGDKVRDMVIRLPVTNVGDPDWSYMEVYMRAVMDRQCFVVEQLKGAL